MFENGQAAMEANGSWLVPTHEAAGLDFGVAPLPKGPAGQATSVNPSGVVVYKGTKYPDAAWEFIKCYTGPKLQAMIASLKASMPANKQVLTDQYATSFDGGKTFADALAYAHLKPSFKGYDEFNTHAPGRAGHQGLQRQRDDGEGRPRRGDARSSRSSWPSEGRAARSRTRERSR